MKVEDVICGMTIDTGSAAARVEHEGETYWFCCEHCRKTFEADPDRYASAGGAEGGGMEHHHGHHH